MLRKLLCSKTPRCFRSEYMPARKTNSTSIMRRSRAYANIDLFHYPGGGIHACKSRKCEFSHLLLRCPIKLWNAIFRRNLDRWSKSLTVYRALRLCDLYSCIMHQICLSLFAFRGSYYLFPGIPFPVVNDVTGIEWRLDKPGFRRASYPIDYRYLVPGMRGGDLRHNEAGPSAYGGTSVEADAQDGGRRPHVEQ